MRPWLLLVVLAALPAGAFAAPVPNDTPRWFTFDQGFRGSAGLSFQFSRPAPTFDGDGQPLAPNVPRFASRTTLVSPPEREVVRNADT